MAKTKHVSLRLDEALKAALDEFAEVDNRPLGNLMETVLKEYAAQRQGKVAREREDAKRSARR
jgi:hypothetical protein